MSPTDAVVLNVLFRWKCFVKRFVPLEMFCSVGKDENLRVQTRTYAYVRECMIRKHKYACVCMYIVYT